MPRKKRAPKATEKPQQLVEMDTFVGGRDVPAFYANAVRIMVSMHDFTLIIGQAAYREDGTPEMREAARLNLSPQHAKALAALLSRRVMDYEDQFGVLPVEVTPSSPNG